MINLRTDRARIKGINMRKAIRILAGVNMFMSFVFISGCSAPQRIAPTPYAVENERRVERPFDATWQSAVEWFATHNTPIKNIDKSSGLISTEYSMSMKDALVFMDCGRGDSTMTGKVEMDNYLGNFNVLIKKIDDNSTKVVVNVFFSCAVKKYRYENLLSTNYVLESSVKEDCVSTGKLEKQILDYLSAK